MRRYFVVVVVVVAAFTARWDSEPRVLQCAAAQWCVAVLRERGRRIAPAGALFTQRRLSTNYYYYSPVEASADATHKGHTRARHK